MVIWVKKVPEFLRSSCSRLRIPVLSCVLILVSVSPVSIRNSALTDLRADGRSSGGKVMDQTRGWPDGGL